MSILHIAFYPSDWLAGTRGLSAQETGIYITLIARMYEMAGPIPRDDARLSRLCGCKTKNAFTKALSYLISEGKITDTDRGLFNDRVKKEIKKVTEKSTKAKQAAQSRWDKKTNQNNDGDDANAPQTHMQNECQLEPELNKKDKTKVLSKKDSENLPVEKPNPKKRGPARKTSMKENWQPTPQDIAFAVTKGLNSDEIRNEADRFYRYHRAKGSTWKDWHLVWCNWINSDFGPIARKRKAEHSAIAGGRSSAIDAALDAAAHQLDVFTFANGGRQEYHAANASPEGATSRSAAEILDADGFVLARG